MRSICLAGAVVLALTLQSPALAHDFGVRGIITGADGVPANDIPGYGAFGHWRLNERWSLGLAVDRTDYDFERPAEIVGLRQDPNVEDIDAIAEATILSAWIERTYPRPGRLEWFWGAGLGYASLDVPDATGPLEGGGTFDVRTEVDSEVIASFLGGLHLRLGERWIVELALRADQHFADWQVTDRISGNRGAVDDYRALGGHFGIGFRF